jgi:hypothetical protein
MVSANTQGTKSRIGRKLTRCTNGQFAVPAIGAPIVFQAMAGTEELYIGRRMASRILRPTTMAELLGPAWDGRLPLEGSRAELDLARKLTKRFEERLGPPVAELWPWTVDPASHPRLLRSRLTWLLLRPGRLDRHLPGGDENQAA